MCPVHIFPGELIGKNVEIIQSANLNQVGLKGKIVDETKSTLKVENDGKIKTLLKRGLTICLSGQILRGENLDRRPEDRIKGK